MQEESQVQSPAGEIKQLQRCINDLVSVLALPAMWSGGQSAQIVQTLLDALRTMLRLDLVYVQLEDLIGEAQAEIVWVGESGKRMSRPQEIGELLKRCRATTRGNGLRRLATALQTKTFRSCPCAWGCMVKLA